MNSNHCQALHDDGYCIIEGAVPADQATALAERCKELHTDPANRSLLQDPNDDLYQTLFGLANLEKRLGTWPLTLMFWPLPGECWKPISG